MKILKKVALFTFISSLLVSCSSGSSETPDTPDGNSIILSKKVMITNAGDGTNIDSGTLTYIDKEGVLTNNFFAAMNGDDAKLGANIKSITFDGDFNYIVVDQYIVIVNSSFIFSMTYYPVLSEPRYVLPLKGTTGYVLNWGTTAETETPYINYIGIENIAQTDWEWEARVYDKFDFVVFDPITEKKPEKIVKYESNDQFKFFITHYESNFITAIEFLNNSQDKQTITLGDNLDDIVEVADNKIAVLAKGNPSDAAIYEIDATDNTYTTKYSFDSGEYPTAMVYANNAYYYSLGDEIYKLEEDGTSPSFVLDATFTDFAIDGNLIYGINASSGGTSTATVYNLTTGEVVKATEQIGINANNIYLFD